MNPTVVATVREAFLAARKEWMFPSDLAESTGWDPTAVDAALADLERGGLIDVWTKAPGNRGPAVTWSAYGAKVLGIQLTIPTSRVDERGVERRRPSRWRRAKNVTGPDRPRKRRRHVFADRCAEVLMPDDDPAPGPVDLVVDASPPPDELVSLHEEMYAAVELRREQLEQLGKSLTPDDAPLPIVVYDAPGTWLEYERTADEVFEPLGPCDCCAERAIWCVERDQGDQPESLAAFIEQLRDDPAAVGPRRGVKTRIDRNGVCPKCQRWGWDSYFAPIDVRHRRFARREAS